MKIIPWSAEKLSLVTEFAGREPTWGWREDTPEIMERQIDLAAGNEIAHFPFCWYRQDNKRPINVSGNVNKSTDLALYLIIKI